MFRRKKLQEEDDELINKEDMHEDMAQSSKEQEENIKKDNDVSKNTPSLPDDDYVCDFNFDEIVSTQISEILFYPIISRICGRFL